LDTNHDVVCPKCGSKAKCSNTKFGVRSYCCDLWSWGGKPLVDGNTHEARKLAHISFDRLWELYGYTRGEAYEALAEEMGLDKKDCHISLMDAETASKVAVSTMSIIDNPDTFLTLTYLGFFVT
jgi:hypothetical protein